MVPEGETRAARNSKFHWVLFSWICFAHTTRKFCPLKATLGPCSQCLTLLALLSISHSCISVDTGPAHAAAALNCPLVVLFGKASPQRFRPVSLDSPVQVIQGFAANALDTAPDIGHITVQQAFAGWCDAISGSLPAQ